MSNGKTSQITDALSAPGEEIEPSLLPDTLMTPTRNLSASNPTVQDNSMDASARSEEGTVCLLKVVAAMQNKEAEEKERQKLESFEQAQAEQRPRNHDGMASDSRNQARNEETAEKQHLCIADGTGTGKMVILAKQGVTGKESNISKSNHPGVHLTEPNAAATTEDTASQISEEGIVPPQLGLVRGQQNIERTVAPGAVAVEGPGFRENDDMQMRLPEEGSGESQQDIPSRDSDDLAVANLVEESHRSSGDLPLAQEHDVDAFGRQKQQRTKKQTKTHALFGIVSLVVAALIVVALVVPNRTGKAGEAAAPIQAVTMAPTSPADGVLALLPAETVSDIEISGSAQSEAFKWLMEEVEDVSRLPKYRILQRYALATLYHAAGGDGWYNTTNWLNHSVHECEWYNKPDFAQKVAINQAYPGYLRGFLEPLPTSVCRYGGIYQHLWLDFHNLVGFLPKELFLMTSLQTMSFSYNQLEGTISSSVGKLTDLEGFMVHNNQLSGKLPSEIGMLTPLSFLGLSDNFLEGSLPEELWNLTRMKMLSFFNNPDIGGTLSSMIGGLSDLRTFVTDRSGLKGTLPTEVGLLMSMDRLALDQNGLGGALPSELGNLSGMRYFSVRGNSLSSTIPSELGRLAAATSLAIGENQLTGPVPSQLGLIGTLYEHLFIAGNLLSSTVPPELGHLTRLQKFEASNNRFSGRLPSEFGQLTSLVRLTLANNSFSGTVPEEIVALSDNLHTFWLQSNPLLSGTIPPNLCNINGACVNSIWLQSDCEGAVGLSFDCTSLLCGCACSCDG